MLGNIHATKTTDTYINLTMISIQSLTLSIWDNVCKSTFLSERYPIFVDIWQRYVSVLCFLSLSYSPLLDILVCVIALSLTKISIRIIPDNILHCREPAIFEYQSSKHHGNEAAFLWLLSIFCLNLEVSHQGLHPDILYLIVYYFIIFRLYFNLSYFECRGFYNFPSCV